MYILFDIGGTKTRIAWSDGERFEEPVIIDTPRMYDDGIALLKKEARGVMQGRPVRFFAGGIAGPVSHSAQSLLASPNLKDWIARPLMNNLESALHIPGIIKNDAAVVGLGEAHYGAGKDSDILAYITVSTGVGGVRIVKGKIDASTVGFEPGHQIIDFDKTALPDALGIQLEHYIGGKAIEKRMGKKPYEILDSNFWDEQARLLAIGLTNTIVHWSPDRIVLGGSMMKKIGIPVDRVEHHLKRYCTIYPKLPSVVKAELGDLGGLWGALVLAREKTIDR